MLEESGQGVTEFCRANGLPESTVSLWREQSREPDAPSEAADFIEVLLPASLQPAPPTGVRSTATIRFADGVALEIDSGTDMAWLAALVRLLRARS